MGLTVVPGEVFALGNHKGVSATLSFTGLYPHDGYDCQCGLIGLTEISGVIPLMGHNGFVFAESGHRLHAFLHGVECNGMMLDGLSATFLFIGH